jgi:di/tricarboxylate transporter
MIDIDAGLFLFVWQRIRYDVVAILMLLSLGLPGILSSLSMTKKKKVRIPSDVQVFYIFLK